MNINQINRLKKAPRSGFTEAIRNRNVTACLVKTAEIHGHYCPGSAFGVMAALMGMEILGERLSSGMEDLMAVVEINACFADGIQAVSGCTLGNNALVFRDLGKMAVTFARRSKDRAVRIKIKGRIRDHVDKILPDYFAMMNKVIKDRKGLPGEAKAFREMGKEAAFALIEQPFGTYFEAVPCTPDLPPYAPIVATLVCPVCRDAVMSTKTVSGGREKGFCLACADRAIPGVDGRGVVLTDNRSRYEGSGDDI